MANKSAAIYAYVLMTNQVHLLVSGQDVGSVSDMMQTLGRRYVRRINQHYGRTGTLWEGRFKSSVIESKRYFLTCMRYIELNPVGASQVFYPDLIVCDSISSVRTPRTLSGSKPGSAQPHYPTAPGSEMWRCTSGAA